LSHSHLGEILDEKRVNRSGRSRIILQIMVVGKRSILELGLFWKNQPALGEEKFAGTSYGYVYILGVCGGEPDENKKTEK